MVEQKETAAAVNESILGLSDKQTMLIRCAGEQLEKKNYFYLFIISFFFFQSSPLVLLHQLKSTGFNLKQDKTLQFNS